MDVADPESVARGLAEVAGQTPHLTTLVNNAGIQRLLDFSATEPPGPADIAAEIATNFAGLINVTAAALPLLRRAQRSRVVHVGSGLGFVPYAKTRVYCATKAAVHSFSVSLRRQLHHTIIVSLNRVRFGSFQRDEFQVTRSARDPVAGS